MISTYQNISNSSRSEAEIRRLNKALLKRLLKALDVWKDTSIKKDIRHQEMSNVVDICDAFTAYMRDEIISDERMIMSSIFKGIRNKAVTALHGEVIDFKDAYYAISFIESSIMEN